LGRIGKSLVKRLSGFEARILVHQPQPDEEYGRNNNITYVDVDTLLGQSDYVTCTPPARRKHGFSPIGRSSLA
jgi:D-3-phosphoglycerate dehydrogenase